MSEMTDEAVFSALTEAAAQDVAAEQVLNAPPASQPAAPVAAPASPQSDAPVEGTAAPEGQAPVQAVEAGGVEQPAQEPAVPFNPDDLPEELIPAWRQMQAAFTPRLQQAAAIQKRFEELGGEDAVQQAIDLYTRVGDPQNWPTLYEELYNAMEEQGFEFEDPALPGTPAAPTVQSPFGDVASDPDLAPLVQELQALRGRTDEQQQLIESFHEEQALRNQMAEEELQQSQYLANMHRQVVSLRQANPHYDDADIREIVKIGTFYGDDLALAAQDYESAFARRMTRYFEKKQAGAPASVGPVTGAGVLSNQDDRPETVEEAARQAEEYLRRLQDAGEISFE